MGNPNISRFALLLAGFTLHAAILFPAAAVARGPGIGIVDPDTEMVVGGEPGEDPHLKVIPVIYVKESEPPPGAPARAGGTERRGMDYRGPWEGKSRLDSRVNGEWRLILRMWLWPLHR